MKFVVLALLSLLPLLVSAQVPVPYTNCGTPSTDHVKITSATASVWPPAPGASVSLDITGVLNEQLTGGSYLLGIDFDGIPLINQQGPLSDMNITFPIEAGNFTFARTITIPSVVPQGSLVTVNASALDSNGQELICIQLAINVPSNTDSAQIDADSMELVAQAEDASQLFKGLVDEIRSIQPATMKTIVAGLLDAVSGEMRIIANQLRSEANDNSTQDQIPVPFTNCGQPSDIVTIESITSSVWPPQLGVSTVLVINLLANEQINDGTYTATVAVDGLPLINKSGDISKYFKLPIVKGPVTINKKVNIPNIGIHGSIGIQLSAVDTNNDELFCLSLAFSV